jgi:hypothetical protein
VCILLKTDIAKAFCCLAFPPRSLGAHGLPTELKGSDCGNSFIGKH